MHSTVTLIATKRLSVSLSHNYSLFLGKNMSNITISWLLEFPSPTGAASWSIAIRSNDLCRVQHALNALLVQAKSASHEQGFSLSHSVWTHLICSVSLFGDATNLLNMIWTFVMPVCDLAGSQHAAETCSFLTFLKSWIHSRVIRGAVWIYHKAWPLDGPVPRSGVAPCRAKVDRWQTRLQVG